MVGKSNAFHDRAFRDHILKRIYADLTYTQSVLTSQHRATYAIKAPSVPPGVYVSVKTYDVNDNNDNRKRAHVRAVVYDVHASVETMG